MVDFVSKTELKKSWEVLKKILVRSFKIVEVFKMVIR
jgi:hypothetical protein